MLLVRAPMLRRRCATFADLVNALSAQSSKTFIVGRAIAGVGFGGLYIGVLAITAAALPVAKQALCAFIPMKLGHATYPSPSKLLPLSALATDLEPVRNSILV